MEPHSGARQEHEDEGEPEGKSYESTEILIPHPFVLLRAGRRIVGNEVPEKKGDGKMFLDLFLLFISYFLFLISLPCF